MSAKPKKRAPPESELIIEIWEDCLAREGLYADLPRMSGDLERDVSALLQRLAELSPRVRAIAGDVPPVAVSARELLFEEEDGLTDLRAAIVYAEAEGWIVERVLGRDRRFRVVALSDAGCEVARRLGQPGDREAFERIVQARRAEEARERAGAPSGFLTPATLAERYDVKLDPLKKRLERWREKHVMADGWIENADRRPNEARYLYDAAKVESVIRASK